MVKFNTMLIDSHAHIFPQVKGLTGQGPTLGIGLGRITVGGKTSQLIPPYGKETLFTPEMLLANMEWAGVDKAVLLQGPYYGECNQYALDAMRTYPDRLVGVAYLDPWDEKSRAAFDWIIEAVLFKGIKLEYSEASGLIGIHPGARLDAPDIGWLWNELESRCKVLVLDLGAVGSASYQTRAVRTIAESHPKLKIVICHLAQPAPGMESRPELWKLWQEQIDLGFLPNIWFDCAALPAYFPNENFPYPSAEIYLRRVIEKLGPTKILWGTDQPGLLTSASLPQLVRMIKRHLEFLSPEEQNLILGDNATGIFY